MSLLGTCSHSRRHSLLSWIHFIELRSANGSQKEHQEVALACAQAIAAIFPMASDLVAKS